MWSSDCRAWALKLKERLKKGQKIVCARFVNSNCKVFFLHFLFNFEKKWFHILNIFLIYVKNTIFKNINDFHKMGWRSDFQKNLPSLYTNLTLLFFLFHWHKPKQKQNHQISTCRAKIRSTRSQTCVKYRGNIIFIKRNTDVNTSDLKNYQKRLIFQALSSISPKFYVVCHQPYAWLESYDSYGSFGTMI